LKKGREKLKEGSKKKKKEGPVKRGNAKVNPLRGLEGRGALGKVSFRRRMEERRD